MDTFLESDVLSPRKVFNLFEGPFLFVAIILVLLFVHWRYEHYSQLRNQFVLLTSFFLLTKMDSDSYLFQFIQNVLSLYIVLKIIQVGFQLEKGKIQFFRKLCKIG